MTLHYCQSLSVQAVNFQTSSLSPKFQKFQCLIRRSRPGWTVSRFFCRRSSMYFGSCSLPRAAVSVAFPSDTAMPTCPTVPTCPHWPCPTCPTGAKGPESQLRFSHFSLRSAFVQGGTELRPLTQRLRKVSIASFVRTSGLKGCTLATTVIQFLAPCKRIANQSVQTWAVKSSQIVVAGRDSLFDGSKPKKLSCGHIFHIVSFLSFQAAE